MTSPIELPSGAVVTVAPPRPPGVEAPAPTPSSLPFLPSPGPRGPIGPAGDNAPIFNETPIGVKDGVNLVFEVVYPFVPGTTAVYLNGLREFPGDGYTESAPNMIVFDEAPSALDKVTVDYIVQ